MKWSDKGPTHFIAQNFIPEQGFRMYGCAEKSCTPTIQSDLSVYGEKFNCPCYSMQLAQSPHFSAGPPSATALPVHCPHLVGVMEYSARQNPPTVMRSMVLHNDNAWLQTCRDVLVKVYSAQPEVHEDDSWPPGGSDTYINLALIKNKAMTASNEYARKTIKKDIDDIYKEKEKIIYEEVFGDLRSEDRLLIEGRPGSGKTTLVHKISRDWESGKLMENVKLLFLIHLRYFLNDPDVALKDLICDHFPNNSTVEQILQHAEQHSEGFCFAEPTVTGNCELHEHTPECMH